MTQTPPRWDLSNVYTSLDDPKFAKDLDAVKKEIKSLQVFFTQTLKPLNSESKAQDLAAALSDYLDRYTKLLVRLNTINAYLNGLVSTDSFNKQAEQMQSRVQLEALPLNNISLRYAAGWVPLAKRSLMRSATREPPENTLFIYSKKLNMLNT